MSSVDDPRVFFAAERTLLAWNRTALSLMAFGFLIERFGLFLEMLGREEIKILQRHISLVIGLAFILFAACLAGYSALQHARFVKTLRAAEVPEGYDMRVGTIVNLLLAIFGALLAFYVLRGFV